MSRKFSYYGSTGVAWSPSDLTNLHLWLDATDESTINLGSPTNGVAVNNWEDKGPNGYDFTQGVAIDQPTWNSTGYGTESTANITFSSSNITNASIPLSLPMTWLVCFQVPSGNYKLIGNDASTTNFTFRAYPNMRMSNPTVLTDGFSRPDDVPMVARALINGLSSEVQTNEETTTSGTTGTNATATGLSIGTPASFGVDFEGEIVEIIITDDAMSVGDYALAYAYLDTKYGF